MGKKNAVNVSDLALDTIVDIILKRPKYASNNLDLLLKYACSTCNDFRRKVTVAICCLYDKKSIQSKIETFAYNSFCNVINTPPYFSGERPLSPSDDNINNNKSKLRCQGELNIWKEKEKTLRIEYLESRSSLLLALLTKNENLVYNQFIGVYIKCNKRIQMELNILCNKMIGHFGSTSNSAIVKLIDEYCPSEGSMFVQHCAWILTNKCQVEVPSHALLNSLYNNFRRNNNPIIFEQILPYLKQSDDIDNILDAVFDQCSFGICKDFIGHLLPKSGDNINTYANGTSMEPTDLLIKIIKFAPTIQHSHIKKMMKCVDFCMRQGLFDDSIYSVTISRLIDVEPLPVLYMRVLWKCIDIFPNLNNLALNMLRRLIEKQCWTNDHIWDGFIRIVKKLLPQSCDVLRLLSKKELSDILNKDAQSNNPVIIPQFRKFVSKHKRNLRSYFGEVLNEAESLIVTEHQVRVFSLKREINDNTLKSNGHATPNIKHNNNNNNNNNNDVGHDGGTRIKLESSAKHNNNATVKTEKQLPYPFGCSNDTNGRVTGSSSHKRQYSQFAGNGHDNDNDNASRSECESVNDEPLKKRLKQSRMKNVTTPIVDPKLNHESTPSKSKRAGEKLRLCSRRDTNNDCDQDRDKYSRYDHHDRDRQRTSDRKDRRQRQRQRQRERFGEKARQRR